MKKFTIYLFLTAILFAFQINAQSPLTVYTEDNYGGTSVQYEIVTPHKDLESFDNSIKSFKLLDGYMATFATSSDGTGYSRVYIADGADIEVPVMPPYLHGTVSFIRTMTFNSNVKKRGWCGTGYPLEDLIATNSSWFYNWDTGVNTTSTIEYVPMRHNLYWPDFGPANTKDGYTHFLGYNEPSHTDQANMTAQQCIDNWKYFMESGLRLGSIAPDNPYNPILGEFMALAQAQNLRVDFIPVHFYDDKLAWQWEGDLTNIWNTYHRPIWITEGNQGANWTGNSFPVNNPDILNDANANYHKNNIQDIVNVLESLPFIERYSLYNWVEPRRSFIINIDDFFRSTNPDWQNYVWLQAAIQNPISTWVDASGDTDYRVLTPAGQAYANTTSNKAYNPSVVYVPIWTPLKENLTFTVSEDFQNITLNWGGKNGELVNKYIVQKKSGFSWTTIYDSSDYTVLSTAPQPIPAQTTEYRIIAVGLDNVQSSQSTFFTVQSVVAAPNDLVGIAVSAKKISLSWSEATNAEAYNIKRSTTPGGTYETVASYITGLNYVDSGLNPETNYYYKISSVNTGGESADSSPEAMVTTMALVAPSSVSNILVGSGDDQVKLKWDLIEDSQFHIKRSDSQSGPFATIATTDFDATGYTDLTVQNGMTYYYVISAFNDAGDSGDSPVVMSDPDFGQHLYYNFNENTGTEINDQWGLYSGMFGSSAAWTNGKDGSGIDLTGASNSYMEIEDGVVKDLTDFTIAIWVKLDALTNWTRIFDFGNNTNEYMFLTPQNGGTGKYRFAIKNGGNEQQINCSVSPVIGVWSHVVITMEGSVGVMYIDGVEVGRNEDFTLYPSNLGITTQNYIGKSQFNDPYLNGTVDEFRIYNRAFTPTEVTALKDRTLDVEDNAVKDKYEYKFLSTDKTISAVYNGNGTAKYKVFALTGQLLSSGEIVSREVNQLGYYKTGIYIVQVKDLSGVRAFKVLVK